MNNQSEKFKEWALKSGFPFENDTLAIINQCMPLSKVTRNVEFNTLNEEQQPTIRSIDFAVSISKETKNIPHRDWRRGNAEIAEMNFIIDCKFSVDESFLFTPSTKPIPITERCWPHLVPMMTKGDFGRTTEIYRRDLVQLSAIDNQLRVAGTGRKVKEQSRERDSVSSALLQIFQGTRHFIALKAETLGKISTVDSSYERNAYFFIPIIVTNAPLLVLKSQISTNQVEKAKSIADVCVAVDQVIVEMPDIYDLKNSWNELKSELSRSHNPNLAWCEHSLTSEQILFCNPQGLQSAMQNFAKIFNELAQEPK